MELIAEKREIFGKQAKGLKEENLIPASIFGKGLESVSIQIDYVQAKKVYMEAGETTLVDVKIDGDTTKVLFKEVQFDPISGRIIHIGFYKPNLKEKTQAQVPVEIIGEEENELVKSGEALVLTILDEITVEALPADLPHSFEVDVSNLAEIDAAVTVGELSYDKEKVEIVDLNPEDLVVKLDHAESLEEEEEEISEEEALEGIEATEETAKEEGEDGEEDGKDKN